MRIGAVYPQIELGGDPDAVRIIGTATEELGYDHLLAYDHVAGADHADRDPVLVGPYTEHDPFHDPFVMFAHLAALTERIELVTGVLILPQRQTLLVARQAADVDLLSGGRLRLGIGVGWNHVEYTALGQDFGTRGARADEQIELLRTCWTEPIVSFHGRFDRVERAAVLPRPERTIPIWVGGFAEPAFRRGARHGDGFIFAGRIDHCLAAWRRVRELLADEERDTEEFGAELVIGTRSTPDEIASIVEQWADAGGTHASVVTMRRGLSSAQEHVDFLAAAKHAIG